MNTKKRAIAFVIILFLILAVGIIYIFSELYTESEIEDAKGNVDAGKFKEEYEKLNGNSAGEDKTYRTLTISEENPFIYSTEDDIVKRIDNKESFIVYFGFNSCPWCRSIINPLIDSAKKNNIETIYYVDVKNIRDTYVLDDEYKPIRSIEGTKGYYELLERLDPILDDYADLTYTYTNKKKKTKTKSVKVDEKRIYAPTVVVIQDGVATLKETGIVDELNDAYMEITPEINELITKKFDEILSTIDTNLTCVDGKGC